MRNLIQIIVILACLLLLVSSPNAQWSTDPANNLVVGYGLLPQMCSDSAGGCYITYEQGLTYPRKLILHRLNKYGIKSWVSGKQISGNLFEQSCAKIVEDGNNGVIVSYMDIEAPDDPHQSATFKLMVQRIDDNGNSLWGITGINASLSCINQANQAIVSDGRGGCVIAWQDEQRKLIVQRIDSAGIRSWSDTGIVIDSNTQYTPQIIALGSEEFVIAYGRTLKIIDLQGELIWEEGVNVGFGTRSILSDKEKNIIVYDASGVPENILYVTQKFDSLGNKLWQNPFIIIADSTIYTNYGYPVNEVGKGVIFVCQKYISSISRLWAQNLSPDGSEMWGNEGILVSSISSQQTLPVSVNGDSNSVIYLWRDSRGGNYAQKLDANGNKIWDSNDIGVCKPNLTDEKITTDCNGGFIFVGSGENFSIRVQQVSRNGNLGSIINGIGDDDVPRVPQAVKLYQNYPNPFNPSTHITFSLLKAMDVTLKVYDILGREVAILVNERKNAGEYSVTWNTQGVPSGVYFYRIVAGEFVETKKIVVAR